MPLGQPQLHLDPLFPLAVRRDPSSFPDPVAASRTVGLLVCTAGGCRIVSDGNATHLVAPALMRVDLAAGAVLRRDSSRGWLLVMGRHLLDQLIVGAFGEPGFSRFLDELGTPGWSHCDPPGAEIDDLLQHLDAELDERQPAYRVRTRSLLTDALLLLYRASLVTPSVSNGDGLRLAAVLDHIEMHFDGELSLKELATMMGTSSSYFSRLFRNEVGMPLFEYINRTRIRKACVMLRRADISVTQIAFDVGYNSVSFFNRYFRRIMHLTPREYRRYLTS